MEEFSIVIENERCAMDASKYFHGLMPWQAAERVINDGYDGGMNVIAYFLDDGSDWLICDHGCPCSTASMDCSGTAAIDCSGTAAIDCSNTSAIDCCTTGCMGCS